MIRKFGRKATVASAVLTLGTLGSALFAGNAMATGHSGDVNGDGGSGGNGGKTNVNCVLPIGATLGLVGQGGDNSMCNATGGGGGVGGDGVS